MSLQTRLALFIAVAIAVALLVQGVFGYASFRQQAYASLDRDLNLYLNRVQTEVLRGRGGRTDPRNTDPRNTDPRDTDPRNTDPRSFGPLGTLPADYLARARVVFQGEVVAQQEGFPEDVPTPLEPTPTPRTYGVWRVGSVAPRGSETPDLLVQAAVSSRDLLQSLRRYRRTLVVTVVSVSALGAFLALLLSRPALRPLQHLLTTAQRVADSGDLSLRVPPGGGGELGALSATFNRMLERLAAFGVRESSFTRNASHELRTPLTAMRLHLSSYREGYGSAEETLSVLDEEVERMTRLSEALLTLAREGRTQRVGVDIADLAKETALKAGAVYRGPERLELSGDPILLRQALVNLLENARKHAPGANVEVTLEPRTFAGQSYAVVSVADDGPGLSPEALHRAGEAFYRAPDTRVPGSGLGLTVVEQVAETHGGRLELLPNAPHGLRAELWLSF